MQLQKVTLKNFGPYKDETLDFTQFKTNRVLITGENRDEEGSDSNGSGKSMCFNAITWAISGLTAKRNKINVSDIIGPFGDEAQVDLELSGRFNLRIRRTRSEKDKSLEFWINNEPKHADKDGKMLSDTLVQETLLSYLGVPKDFAKNWFEDYMNLTYFSKDVAKVFTDSSSKPSDKFEFVSRYLSLMTLDLCKENASKKLNYFSGRVKETETKIDLLENRLKSIESQENLTGQITSYQKNILVLEKEFSELEAELEKINRKTQLNSELSNKTLLLNDKKLELNKKLNDLKLNYDKKLKEYEELEGIKEEINTIKSYLTKTDINGLYEKLQSNEKEANDLTVKVNDLTLLIRTDQRELNQFQHQLKSSSRCPKCSTDLMIIDNNIKLLNTAEIELKISDLTSNMNKLNIDLNNISKIKSEALEINQDLKNNIEQYKLNKSKLDLLELKSSNREKLAQEINEIIDTKDIFTKTVHDLISNLEDEIKKLEIELSNYNNIISLEKYKENSRLITEKIKTQDELISRNTFLLEKLKEEKEELKELEKSRKEFAEMKAIYDFAIKAFPTIKKRRIDDFIPSFRLETNNFLNKFKSKIKITVDTDRETKKGTIQDAFPIGGIDPYGKERGLETFSEGEKARISLSIAWALRSLINNQDYLPFSFIMMDEIADGLDEQGIKFLTELIDRTEGQFYIITHFGFFKDLFSEKINIIKENGQSKIHLI